MSMRDDLANRSTEICWPKGFEPENADLFAHNQKFIEAPAEKVWKLLIEQPKWPEWYPNSKNARIRGGNSQLDADSIFWWTTSGLHLETKVSEFEPCSRLTWLGYESGGEPQFCHAWHIIPQDGGCLVVTDESARGPLPRAFREANENGLHRSHEMWLSVLKWKAESN